MNDELAALLILILILVVVVTTGWALFQRNTPDPDIGRLALPDDDPAPEHDEIADALIILVTHRVDTLIADINRGGAMTDDVIDALLELRSAMTKVGAAS